MGGCWPVGYLHNTVEELNSGLPRTNPDSGRVKDLNQGPPDCKSGALNHLATPPPLQILWINKKLYRMLHTLPHSVSVFAWHLLPSLDLNYAEISPRFHCPSTKNETIIKNSDEYWTSAVVKTGETNTKELWSKTLSPQCLINGLLAKKRAQSIQPKFPGWGSKISWCRTDRERSERSRSIPLAKRVSRSFKMKDVGLFLLVLKCPYGQNVFLGFHYLCNI